MYTLFQLENFQLNTFSDEVLDWAEVLLLTWATVIFLWEWVWLESRDYHVTYLSREGELSTKNAELHSQECGESTAHIHTHNHSCKACTTNMTSRRRRWGRNERKKSSQMILRFSQRVTFPVVLPTQNFQPFSFSFTGSHLVLSCSVMLSAFSWFCTASFSLGSRHTTEQTPPPHEVARRDRHLPAVRQVCWWLLQCLWSLSRRERCWVQDLDDKTCRSLCFL